MVYRPAFEKRQGATPREFESPLLRSFLEQKTKEKECSRVTTTRGDSNGLVVYTESTKCHKSGDQDFLERRQQKIRGRNSPLLRL